MPPPVCFQTCKLCRESVNGNMNGNFGGSHRSSSKITESLSELACFLCTNILKTIRKDSVSTSYLDMRHCKICFPSFKKLLIFIPKTSTFVAINTL